MPKSTGTMRHAVAAVSAVHQSTVPWCAVIIRNVFGVGGGAHVPHTQTPRIQEVHLLALHCLCDAIDCLLLGVD